MKSDIRSGRATVIAAERTIKGVLAEGWALPGGKFTTDRLHAQTTADYMAKVIKVNNRRAMVH